MKKPLLICLGWALLGQVARAEIPVPTEATTAQAAQGTRGDVYLSPRRAGAVLIEASKMLFVATNGNNATAVKGRRDKPYATPSYAATNAVAGETVFLMPGRFIDNNIISLSNNVNLVGSGKYVSTIYSYIPSVAEPTSSNLWTGGASICPGTNTVIANLGYISLCSNRYSTIIGIDAVYDPNLDDSTYQHSSDNVQVYSCFLSGYADVFYFNGSGTSGYRIYVKDCDLLSSWDFVGPAINNNIDFQNCSLNSYVARGSNSDTIDFGMSSFANLGASAKVTFNSCFGLITNATLSGKLFTPNAGQVSVNGGSFAFYNNFGTNNSVITDASAGSWWWQSVNAVSNMVLRVPELINAALTVSSSVTASNGFIAPQITVNLTADNQVVGASTNADIFISSDNGTAGNRTFVLTTGVPNKIIHLIWSGTNAGELVDDSANSGSGNVRLNGTWTPTQYDVLTLVGEGNDWYEVSRSAN